MFPTRHSALLLPYKSSKTPHPPTGNTIPPQGAADAIRPTPLRIPPPAGRMPTALSPTKTSAAPKRLTVIAKGAGRHLGSESEQTLRPSPRLEHRARIDRIGSMARVRIERRHGIHQRGELLAAGRHRLPVGDDQRASQQCGSDSMPQVPIDQRGRMGTDF